jgi:hypothetical protein
MSAVRNDAYSRSAAAMRSLAALKALLRHGWKHGSSSQACLAQADEKTLQARSFPRWEAFRVDERDHVRPAINGARWQTRKTPR